MSPATGSQTPPCGAWGVVAGLVVIVQGLRLGGQHAGERSEAQWISRPPRRPARAAARRLRLHLRHRADERDLLRHHDPDPAESHQAVRRRRHRRRGRMERAVRGDLGGHAVRLRADAGHAVRPLRPAAGDAGLDFRPVRRFPVHGLRPQPGVALPGRILNGMTAASFSTANAYVADITPPDRRARNFGMLGSAFGFGFIIGPSVGGLLGEISLRLPFMVAAGLCLINWLYGLLVLPNPCRPSGARRRSTGARANPLGSLIFLRRRGDLLGLATVGFLSQLALTVLPNIFVLYTGYRYHWTPGMLGLVFMASGASMIAVQMFLVGPAVKAVGERGAVLLGAAGGRSPS